MDYQKAAKQIVENIGGAQNVSGLGHCLTRLRFVLKDESLVNRENVEEIEGVLGTAWGAGQFQIIMGSNLLPAYEELMKSNDFTSTAGGSNSSSGKPKEKEKLTVKKVFRSIVDYMSGSVSPVITSLMAGGIVKLILYFVSLFAPAATETVTYTLLANMANVPFYFMPVFIAYGASQKLGMNPVIPMLVACALLDPNFMNFEGEANLLGLGVQIIDYSTSAIPAMLSTFAVYYIEKAAHKVLPGILRNLFAGPITFLIGFCVTVLWLGPVGTAIGNFVVGLILSLNNFAAPLALGVLAAVLPFMIMGGVHGLIAPFMVENFSTLGYDPLFRPALLLTLCACAGAAYGMAVYQKKDKRTDSITMGTTALLAGISEPTIYGVLMKYRAALIGAICGALGGGIIGGLMGMRAYILTKNTILALPVFQDTIVAAICGRAATLGIAMAVTMLIYKKESQNKKEEGKNEKMIQPVKGKMIDIDQVNDPTFANRMIGDGVAFLPESNDLVAPISGTVVTVFPTGHAYGIRAEDGTEVLIHVGIDTVNLQGKGFTPKVSQDQKVKAGDLLAVVDFDLIKNEGYDPTVMLVFPDVKEMPKLEWGNA